MSNRFGIQCQWDSSEALRYNSEIKPDVFMGIETDKLEFYRQVHADNPGVGVIWRHHPNRPWADDPERQAKEAVEHIRGRIGHLLDANLVRWVTCNNEYIMSDAPPELVAKASRYIAAFIPAARANLGVGTCWGNFNTGHWGGGPTGGQEIIDAFHLALEAAQEDGDSPIAFHEYNWPVIRDDGHYTCGKILRAMPAIAAKYPRVRCMITEFGVDDGGNPHKGFRLAHPDYNTAVEMFCQGLSWYDIEVVQKAPWLIAVVIFGCGMFGDWASFDFGGEDRIFGAIKSFGGPYPEPPAPEPEPEPPAPEPEPEPPNNGGDEMSLEHIKVFKLKPDYSGHVECISLADKEALVYQKYGAAFRQAEVGPGQKVYRLAEIWEKTGHSSLITQVLNEQGKPMDKIDVAFYWPNAPEPPDPPTPLYPHDWHRNFVHGLTNVNGDVGPGMGTGAYHGEGKGGPHATWVRDRNIPSDIFEKLGMIAGTFHDHLDHKFRLVTVGETPGPGPGPAPGKLVPEFVETVEEPHDSMMLGIAIIVDTKPEKDWMWDIRGILKGPGANDEINPGEWTYPATGQRCSMVAGCCDYGGTEGEEREYSIALFRLPDRETILAGPKKLKVKALGQSPRKRVVHVYRLVSEEPPTPEPPTPEPPGPEPPTPEPPSDSITAFAQASADLAEELSAAWSAFAAKMREIG